MTDEALAAVALLIVGWAVVSGALARHDVTGPLVFAVAGFVISNPQWGWLPIDVQAGSIHRLAEVTLALVLFSDAARVRLLELRHDASLPLRLLGIGLPLTLIGGGVVAAVIFDQFTWAMAGFVGAALAPTDAALSVQVIGDERVPRRLRRGLNIESGLNDGIVTPLVAVTLAVVAAQIGIDDQGEVWAPGTALRELGLGLVVGLALGWLGARVVTWASRRNWMASGGVRIATLGGALAAFTLAVAVDGNGFIAAFVAGLVYGSTLDEDAVSVERAIELPDLGGQLLALVVWFVFGATLVPIALDHLAWSVLGYALLSLTIIRMLPVLLSLVGSGLDRRSRLFVAWFGPRGLASVVFAVLAIEELEAAGNEAVAVVALTVLLSVLLHGITAGPAGRRYGQVGRTASDTGEAPRGRRDAFSLHLDAD